MEIIWLITGIAIGGIATWFVAKFKFAAQQNNTPTRVHEAQLTTLQNEFNRLKKDLENERQTTTSLNIKLSTTESDYRHLQEKLANQKKELTELQEKFSTEFKNLANEILEEKTKKFTDQNKVSMGELLNPLKEKIATFEQKVEQSNKDNLQNNTALREQIKGLKELNQQITKEAENLTKALKGDTKTQGNWGEFILESILQKSGLEKNREYQVQESLNTEDGKRYQPDVVIKLPDNKNIIVDSKVSLVAYEQFVNGEEGDKTTFLKMHIDSVYKHIKNLNEKNYQDLYGVKGLDFVLLFMPIEPAFSLAVQHSNKLFTDAYEKNIVIVSPTTLIATLRTIANIWKNEYQNRNALEIARQGGNLYDKFVAFTEDLRNVGKHMDASQKVYDEAMNKLVDGNGNLVNRMQKIKDLGVKTSKKIAEKLVEDAGQE